MRIATFLIAFALFFILTPGVITRLPSKQTIVRFAVIHALLFAFVWVLVHRPLLNALGQREGMSTSGSDGNIKLNLRLRDDQINQIKNYSGNGTSGGKITLGSQQALLSYAFYLYQIDKRPTTQFTLTKEQMKTIIDSNSLLPDFTKYTNESCINVKPTDIVLSPQQWSEMKSKLVV